MDIVKFPSKIEQRRRQAILRRSLFLTKDKSMRLESHLSAACFWRRIVKVIEKYFHLKKNGDHYKSLCPFHEDINQSFHVFPKRQLFYCFGCGTKGNIVDFVMQYEKVNEITAWKILGKI